MNQSDITITENGTTLIGKIIVNPNKDFYLGTYFVSGTFNSGSLKFQASPDDGVTMFDIPDLNGELTTITDKAMIMMQLPGTKQAAGALKIFAVLSGATGTPVIKVDVFDNREY